MKIWINPHCVLRAMKLELSTQSSWRDSDASTVTLHIFKACVCNITHLLFFHFVLPFIILFYGADRTGLFWFCFCSYTAGVITIPTPRCLTTSVPLASSVKHAHLWMVQRLTCFHGYASCLTNRCANWTKLGFYWTASWTTNWWEWRLLHTFFVLLHWLISYTKFRIHNSSYIHEMNEMIRT